MIFSNSTQERYLATQADEPVFTIFTPTFNRAHLLINVYNSLLVQTFSDFEWVIVDDGSTDETRALVDSWKSTAPFPIRYFFKNNGGKHTAYNQGVSEARGRLFLALDSDDSCVPNTLARLWLRWNEIPEGKRNAFSGITCLCKDINGDPIGGLLPSETIDGFPYRVLNELGRVGEMWGFHRTDILRQFSFPEFRGERFIPEALVWNRIGRIYKIRFINEALREYVLSPDSLSNSTVKIRARSPIGTCMYYKELAQLPSGLAVKFRALVNYSRFCFHQGLGVFNISINSGSPIFCIPAIPIGYYFYLSDRRLLNSQVEHGGCG